LSLHTDCCRNDNTYSMSSGSRSAACIKRAPIHSAGGSTTVANSYIRDNSWVGIWCDYDMYGIFDIEDN
jgi:hypothetical protein